MKQLLFLLLFPCIALAQYPGNAGQKITLGEQTTADGLVYRGLAADTTRKPSVDTMAFILLDTNTNIIWQYKKATNNAWTRVGGSISSGVTGVLPVANGGTNTSTAFTAGSVVFAGASGTYTQDNSNLFYDNTNKSLLIGVGANIGSGKAGVNSPNVIQANSSGRVFSAIGRASSDLISYLFYKNNADSVMAGFDIRTDRFAINSYNKIGIRFQISEFHNTGVVEKMRLTYEGRLGIGIAAPTEELHVVGNGLFTGSVTGARFNPTASTLTGTGMYLPAANTLGFTTNGTNKMTINSVGNVGIGTASPSYALDVIEDNEPSQTNIYAIARFTGSNAVANDLNIVGPSGSQVRLNFGRVGRGQDGEMGYNNNTRAFRLVTAGNLTAVFDSLQRVGIGIAGPTARLHLAAGTATAGTAPLKFTSGTNLTTAEAGAMEFNGTNLFFSPSTTRHTVNHGLTSSATLNFPSTTTLLSADLTITVTGAADGDVVSLGVPNAAVNANTCYTAWVSAANTVTVRFNNYSSGTVDPASGTFKVFVTK